MKVVCVIQARMGSSRLPGKVLEDIERKPLLWHVVHRAKLATCLDLVIVATPDTREDLAIHAACAEWDVPCIGVKGTDDVLGRYAAIAAQVQADVIVRITADCPFVDPRLIDLIVWRMLDRRTNYSSNVYPSRTFPDGLDVEVFSREVLTAMDALAWDAADREHVTPLLRRCVGDDLACTVLDPSLGDLRWTVDTAEDMAFVREIFRRLAPRWDFTWQDVLSLGSVAWREAA